MSQRGDYAYHKPMQVQYCDRGDVLQNDTLEPRVWVKSDSFTFYSMLLDRLRSLLPHCRGRIVVLRLKKILPRCEKGNACRFEWNVDESIPLQMDAFWHRITASDPFEEYSIRVWCDM